MTRSSPLCGVVAIVLCSLVGGCEPESSEPTMQISGTVTYKGKPVPKGTIDFEPDPTKGGTGMAGFATITDGKFDTRLEGGRGIYGGPYVIRVLAFDGKPADEAPYGKELFSSEYIEKRDLPKEDTTLEIAITKVDPPPSASSGYEP